MSTLVPVVYTVGGLRIGEPMPWLTTEDDPTAVLVAHEAHATLGTREWPIGSNRGPEVDRWLHEAKVPESVIKAGQGYWCAAWVGAMRRAAGLEMPAGYYDCDVIWRWARETGRFSVTPALGAIVLYGKKDKPDARHVGLVIDVRQPTLTIEANTSIEGSAFERNGTAVALKLVQPNDPVIGYVHIYPVAQPLKQAA